MTAASEKQLRVFVMKHALRIDEFKVCAEKTRLEGALDQIFDTVAKPVAMHDPNEVMPDGTDLAG